MHISHGIAPCLWFDRQAEEAATFYTSVFKNSRVVGVSRYPKAGQEVHKQPPGSVMTVEFELDGQRFTALNGGPDFTFSEAISLQIYCENQEQSITTGTSSHRVATRKRRCAGGSRTSSVCRGR